MRTGQIVVTRGIADRLANDISFAKEVAGAITRYRMHDWGNLSEEDKQLNEEALLTKDRIMGAYEFGSDKIWIITDPGHEVTTILFPDEY